MKLPEPERFTAEELAERWGQSTDYIKECVRTFRFKRVLIVDDGPGLPVMRHYYFDRESWPYGNVTAFSIGPRETARFYDTETLPQGFQCAARLKLFIVSKEVERFEQENGFSPTSKGTARRKVGIAKAAMASKDPGIAKRKAGKPHAAGKEPGTQ